MRSLEQAKYSTRRVVMRLVWLLACLGVGLIVGVVVSSVTASPIGYLAVPVALAIGWLFVANPLACQPPAGSRGNADAP